jgi:hypothetical protein
LAGGVTRPLICAWIALVASIACRAEKVPEAPEPPALERPERTTDLDALEHDLAIAEQRLNAELEGRLAAEGDRDADEALESAPQEPRLSAEQRPREQRESAGSRHEAELGTACDVACRALASMKRSVASICSLTSDDDARCVRARSRVRSAEKNVRRAGCVCRER